MQQEELLEEMYSKINNLNLNRIEKLDLKQHICWIIMTDKFEYPNNSLQNTTKKFYKLSSHKINIAKALINNLGYCPCIPTKSENTKCPCTVFLETGICHCNLFLEDKI